VVLLALEGVAGEAVVALADGEHGAALPVGGLGGLLLDEALEVLLVGDGLGDALAVLDELAVHVDDDLIQHFFWIFGLVDEVVDVGLDELREAGKDPHLTCLLRRKRRARRAP